MTPIDYALALSAQRGWTQARFADEIGVTSAHITNWKKRGMPAGRYPSVAARMGITVDELLNGGPCEPHSTPHSLSAEELALVNNYRAATQQGRAAARAVLSALTQQQAARTGTSG